MKLVLGEAIYILVGDEGFGLGLSPGKGLGVFATKDIPKDKTARQLGTPLDVYIKKTVVSIKRPENQVGSALVAMGKGKFGYATLDATECVNKNKIGGLINRQDLDVKPNAQLQFRKEGVWAKILTPIPKGSELLTNYGCPLVPRKKKIRYKTKEKQK